MNDAVRLLRIVFLFLLLPATAHAAAGTALRADRMLDVTSGETIPDGVVLVQGDRIVAAGASLDVPAGWAVRDLGDVTLMPGLIDAHAHLFLDINPRISNEKDFARLMNERGEARRMLIGARQAREYLEAGFTTVRDVGNAGRYGGTELAAAIDRGWLDGPRVISCGRSLSPPGGQLGPTLRDGIEREFREVRGAEDARRAVRDVLGDGALCVKLIVEAYETMSAEEVQAAVAESHVVGARVTAHAMSPFAVLMAIEAGVDSIDHGYFVTDSVLAEMATRNVALIPTDLSLAAVCELFYADKECTEVPSEFAHLLTSERRRLREAEALGVTLAAGSDMFYRWPGRTRGEAAAEMFTAYAEAGIEPLAIVRAATVDAANVVGVAKQTGTLAAGMQADVIAVEGNPLADARALGNVVFVMRAGNVHRDDLDQQE